MNRLASESSPYLNQHASNPVDWYPWGKEAFERAEREGKPVFLSIGYSACHWCHVMAHESFENEQIAQFLNDNFINIKVDREERPDIDHIYMQAVQTMSGRGGWPLSVFITPDGKPFFGGTYFPSENRQGMPGFAYVLRTIKNAYLQNKGEIIAQAAELQAALSRTEKDPCDKGLSISILGEACDRMVSDIDQRYGGFGTAPKFPEPMAIEFLLRTYGRTKKKDLLDAVELTLGKMACGGIYDQLAGGFHRYSTDNMWRVPHFEKMLYDNALLSGLYLHAYQATGNRQYGNIACESLDFLLREMKAPGGGFYSAIDADSDGSEGKYYLWSKKEIGEVVGANNLEKVASYYNVTAEGNFEGMNVLYKDRLEDRLAEELRQALLTARSCRIKPGRDEKVIVSWNAMAISTFAEAAAVFGRRDYLNAAEESCDFIVNNIMKQNRLTHTWKDGKVGADGYLEDYALLIIGMLDLNAVTFSVRRLDQAQVMADMMIELFLDRSDGLLYDNARDSEQLFIKPRNVVDGAVPAGNSAAVRALFYLGAVTGNQMYLKVARTTIEMLQQRMAAFPRGFANWLCALDFHLSAPLEIVISGKRRTKESEEMIRAVFGRYLPNKIVAGNESGTGREGHIELLKNREPAGGYVTAFVCREGACQQPVTKVADLVAQLDDIGR